MYKKFTVEDVDETQLSKEDLFHRRMLQIYVRLRDEQGYAAVRFLNSVRKHGGVEHAKRSLRRPVKMQGGFEALRAEGRLDMSMEYFVCRPEFSALFTDWEREEALRRLTT